MPESPNHEQFLQQPAENFLQQLQADPLAAVSDYYAHCLQQYDQAMAFAQVKLEISVEEAHSRRIGFSDRSLGKHIPSKRTKLGRQLREQLTELGLYKSNGRETLRGCVTEPITDSQGNTIGIRGHKVYPHAAV